MTLNYLTIPSKFLILYFNYNILINGVLLIINMIWQSCSYSFHGLLRFCARTYTEQNIYIIYKECGKSPRILLELIHARTIWYRNFRQIANEKKCEIFTETGNCPNFLCTCALFSLQNPSIFLRSREECCWYLKKCLFQFF